MVKVHDVPVFPGVFPWMRQIPVEPLQHLAVSAAELPGAALVARFLSCARAEWQQLKAKAETLELQAGMVGVGGWGWGEFFLMGTIWNNGTMSKNGIRQLD
jgi:hypothetical protein